jgi:phosphoribosylglycinamide formyltransferase 1
MNAYSKIRIAVFSSGTGTNTANILEYSRKHKLMEVTLIVSDKADSGAINLAKSENIASFIIPHPAETGWQLLLDEMIKKDIRLVVMAGFLKLMPQFIISALNGNVINLHPALLPGYGGKGMFGIHVHKAVIAANEQESGITIHYANEHYDEGKMIFQKRCPVYDTDTPESLAGRIRLLEHEYYPVVIETLVKEKFSHI